MADNKLFNIYIKNGDNKCDCSDTGKEERSVYNNNNHDDDDDEDDGDDEGDDDGDDNASDNDNDDNDEEDDEMTIEKIINSTITSNRNATSNPIATTIATNLSRNFSTIIDKRQTNNNNNGSMIDGIVDKRKLYMKIDCSMESNDDKTMCIFDSKQKVKIAHYNKDLMNSGSSKSSGIDKGSSIALSIDRSSVDTLSSGKNDSEFNNASWIPSEDDALKGEMMNTIDSNKVKSTSKNLRHDNINDNLDIETRAIANETRQSPKIPDGGWGWMVVMASLIISMIADGVSFSFGLLYIEFLHEFGASKARTAWIGSLFMAVPLLSGPIMSALVDRYGCRHMTIIGGLISGFGFVLSSFSNTIEVMYLTFGVIAGLGLGLCYVTAVVSIAYWFDKKRTLAVSLGACGTGIGTFVYAPMTAYFIREYGWRGTCLLLAGTFFNLIVCGTVMRDPEWWISEQNKQQSVSSPRKSLARSEGGRSYSPISTEEFPGVDELRRLLKSGKAPEYLLDSLRTSTEAPNKNESSTSNGYPGFRSVVNLPTFVRQSEKVPLEVLESLSGNSRLYNVILENYPSLLLCRSISDKKLDEPTTGEVTNKTGVTMSMRIKQATDKNLLPIVNVNDSRAGSVSTSMKPLLSRKISKIDINESINPVRLKEIAQCAVTGDDDKNSKNLSRQRLTGIPTTDVRIDSLPWLRRQFSTNTHYFKDIRVHRNSVMYRGAVLNLHKYRLRASSCPNIYKNSMTTLAKEYEEKWYTELVDLLRGMMDFSMFLELHFLLLSLSTILLFTWFIVPYFYLAEHLTRNGYSEADGAKLLSIIGITNTVGMVGLGWAGDQSWMNVSKTYTACLIACGIATIFMSVFTQYYILLIISSALFGLFFASNFSFTPVILVELIPLERFTTAYGLSLLCQGIGNLLGPPLAGWIFDVTNSWDLSFLMAGGWIIISGLLMGIIPYTKNRKIWGSGPIEMDRYGDRDSMA